MPYKDPEQRKKYAREWVAARRASYLSDKKCVRCGTTEDLRIDHIDPSTKVHHTIWSWSWKRINEELKKCQVLCDSCHKDKTRENKEFLCGSEVPTSLMTEDVVASMRVDYSSGEFTFRELENKYGFKADTIRYAVNRGWKHVNGAVPESGLSEQS